MSESDQPNRPLAGENNLWYYCNTSDAVLVFVHGIFSDSRSCWFYEDKDDPARSCFWPELIRQDKRFGDPSIYLAGYYTAFDSGPYEVRNCAEEIYQAMTRPDRNCREPLISRQSIVFICHSTGGIVARYLLDSWADAFAKKRVGLVLIASPSYGSRWANRLDWLSKFYKNRLGRQLQWGNWSLRDLDARFKNLVNERSRIPRLSGIEAYENHFIFHRKFIPNNRVVVTEESAGRYFGAPVLLRATDHFTAAKPTGLGHPSHQMLVSYWCRFRAPEIRDLLANAVEHVPLGPVADRDGCAGNAAPALALARVSDFWDSEPNVLSEGQLVTVEGTVSKFAPLLIGSPQRKRRLHLQFREWLETQVELNSEKRAQVNAYLAYSAGQMVWRLEAPESQWRFLGFYQSIVRNSIPLFVHRDFFAAAVAKLLPPEKSCIEAKVTGRVGQVRGRFFEELIDLSLFDGPIRPAIDESEGRPVCGLFVDGNGTGIEYLRETPYLDGDIWIALHRGGEERFVARFVNLADFRDIEREAQLLHEHIRHRFPDAEIICEFDHLDTLFADYASADADQILKRLTS